MILTFRFTILKRVNKYGIFCNIKKRLCLLKPAQKNVILKN